jgi:hypothetical protein
MKYLLIALVIAAAVGCENPDKDKKPDEVKVDKSANAAISVTTVNGCEYVVLKDYYAGGITHSGNCSNPIHRNYPNSVVTTTEMHLDTVISLTH